MGTELRPVGTRLMLRAHRSRRTPFAWHALLLSLITVTRTLLGHRSLERWAVLQAPLKDFFTRATRGYPTQPQ